MSRLEGEPTCGVDTHVIKAKLERNSFFVQTKVKGGSRALQILLGNIVLQSKSVLNIPG